MRPSTQDIIKFKELHQKSFGLILDDQEAIEQATQLLRLMQLIYQPLSVRQLHSASVMTEKLHKTQDSAALVPKTPQC